MRSPALPAAERAGVDVVSQANNHAYDDGPAGLMDSLGAIRDADLVPVGAGSDRRKRCARRASRSTAGGSPFSGSTRCSTRPMRSPARTSPARRRGHDFALALQAVRDAAASSDIVVVMIHWGVELDARPRAYQVEQAHRMIDAGADVIFGSHPHRLQPVETYRGRPIFYSLGNLVWPRVSPTSSTTAIAEVVVTPDGAVGGRLIPVEIVSDGHPVLVHAGRRAAERRAL